jgi:hypothetical protein
VRADELIVRVADRALELQAPDGSFAGGHNGPYGDPETPVRNTAHWSLTLLKAHSISGDRAHGQAARRAADYLIRPSNRPMGATFLCRTNPAKDFSNGLIGQAWTIAALLGAARASSDERYHELAREVFRLHPFDSRRGLWQRVNVDGSRYGVDRALNHQLWFAAAGSQLIEEEDGEIAAQLERFLDRTIAASLQLHPSGRIRHALGPLRAVDRVRMLAGWLRHPHRTRSLARELAYKELGYHAFNLYALADLNRYAPEHPMWRSRRFAKTLLYLESAAIAASITNTYGGPYNPAGFEAAHAILSFGELVGLDLATAGSWIERQLDHTWDRETSTLSRNSSDPTTLAARFYELTRIADLSIEVGDRCD